MDPRVLKGLEHEAELLEDRRITETIFVNLRDQFAVAAMQAAAKNPVGAGGFTFEERAKWTYQQADAMLVARNT